MNTTSTKDLILIKAFVKTFQYYQVSKASQPLKSENSFNLLGSIDVEDQIRVRLGRATIIRKFTFSKTDELYLEKVLNALERLNKLNLDTNSYEHLRSVLDELSSGNAGPFSIYENETSTPTPDSKIVRDILYGLLLHGDPKRLNRHLRRNQDAVNLALFSWLQISERVCQVVYGKALAAIKA